MGNGAEQRLDAVTHKDVIIDQGDSDWLGCIHEVLGIRMETLMR